MDLDISQIITQIIAFLVMLWVLKKFGWTPLLNILEERRNKIQSEFDALAKQKEDLDGLIKEYKVKLSGIETEARRKIQEAVAHGRNIATKLQEEAQTKSKELIEANRVTIETEIAKARQQLKNELVQMVFLATEKLLGQKLDEAKHEKLIAEFVEEAELK